MQNPDLQALREQIGSDFEMTWKMIGQTADSVDRLRVEFRTELTEAIERIHRVMDRGFGDVAERLRQVEGRMRLTEERFSLMLQAVTSDSQELRQGMAELKAGLDDLRPRVEALERRDPAA